MRADGTASQARADQPAAAAKPAPAADTEPAKEESAPACLPGCLSYCLGGLAMLLAGIGLVLLYLALQDHFTPGRQLSKLWMGLFLALAFLVPAGLVGCFAYVLSGLGRRRP
jgi:hypothetical protein